MRRILAIVLLCFPVLLSSCTGAVGYILEPVQIDTINVVSDEEESAEEAYAIVDWMIFVRYSGRSYTRDFGPPTVIPAEQIGEKLGTVEHHPPSNVPLDYEEPDLLSFGYRIGAPFYAIKDVNSAYEIAVYDADAGEYHRLQYTDYLPNHTQIVRDGRLLAEYNYPAVRLFETYNALPVDHKEQFPDYNEAFFRDNVLAVIYLEEGSGSVSHSVTGVRRVGDSIEIHIRREIPEVGTCDMAYWAIAAAISREDWDGAAIVPCVSGYASFPMTAKDNAAPFYVEHPANIYVRYGEQTYISVDHTNAPIAESALGKQLGTVEHEIPKNITAGYTAPDRSAKGFAVGVPIYEVLGMDPDYFLAVSEYAGGNNFLMYRYDAVIAAKTEILYDERVREDGELHVVQSRAELDALFEADTAPDVFADLDDAFFADRMMVLIPFLSRPENISFHVPAVYRMGDSTVFCVQRDVGIPTRGQTEPVRDVILCVILDKAEIAEPKFRLWHTTFSE